jgi:hypothetical protein
VLPAVWLALVLLCAQWQGQVHGYLHGHLGLARTGSGLAVATQATNGASALHAGSRRAVATPATAAVQGDRAEASSLGATSSSARSLLRPISATPPGSDPPTSLPGNDLADCALCLASAASSAAAPTSAAPVLAGSTFHAAPAATLDASWRPAFTPVYASRAPPRA